MRIVHFLGVLCLGINYAKVQQYSVSQEKKRVLSGIEKRNSGSFVKASRYWFGIEREIVKWGCWFLYFERHFVSDDIEYTSKFFSVFLDICFTR